MILVKFPGDIELYMVSFPNIVRALNSTGLFGWHTPALLGAVCRFESY